jgi:hypothetical protein
MTMSNFDETPAPQSVPPRSWRPSDYYSGPSPERAFPLWVTFGCGGVALLVMLVVFAGGAWMSGGGFNDVMDLSLGMTMGQIRGMYQPDVTDAQKKALDEEIKTVRKNLSSGKLNLQPLLQTISKATGDEKVTKAEADEILAAARRANEKPKP